MYAARTVPLLHCAAAALRSKGDCGNIGACVCLWMGLLLLLLLLLLLILLLCIQLHPFLSPAQMPVGGRQGQGQGQGAVADTSSPPTQAL